MASFRGLSIRLSQMRIAPNADRPAAFGLLPHDSKGEFGAQK